MARGKQRGMQIVKTKSAEEREIGLSEARKEFRRLAKKANQRMVNLEKAGLNTPALKNANKWLNKQLDKKGNQRIRFKEAPKNLTQDEYRKELYQINKFLEAKSSLKNPYLKAVAKKDKRFTDKGFKQEELDDLWKIFSSALYKKILSKIPSDQIHDTLLELKKIDGLDFDSIDWKEPELLTNKQKKILMKFYDSDDMFDIVEETETADMKEQYTLYPKKEE